MRRFDFPAVIVLAGLVRLLVLFSWSPELSGDALDYDRLAHSLVEGRGYVNAAGEPTSWRPPLYPAFVAAAYALTGGWGQGIRFLQVLLDLGTVASTYAIGKGLFGPSQGLVAAVLVAFNLGSVAAAGRLLSETLFTALLVVAVLTSIRWLKAIMDNDRKAAITLGMGTGALLGAGALTRGVLLFYPFLLAVSVLVFFSKEPSAPTQSIQGRGRVAVAGTLAMLLAFVVMLTPWTVRNHRVQGAFVPIATQLGVTLYASYNPPEGWIFGILPRDEVTAAAERLREAEGSKALVRATLRSIWASPIRTLKLEALKVLYLWAPFDWEILPFYGMFNPTYAFIALWAVGHVAFSFRRESLLPDAAMWLPVLYLFGMALIFYGSPRLRLPMEPLLAVFAGAQVVAFSRRVARRTSVAVIGGTVALLLLAGAFAGPLKHFGKERIFSPWKSSGVHTGIARL